MAQLTRRLGGVGWAVSNLNGDTAKEENQARAPQHGLRAATAGWRGRNICAYGLASRISNADLILPGLGSVGVLGPLM